MDLYYEVSGKGKPLVLLHSGAADLRDWTYITPLLAKQYKVIALDGRGAGKSPVPLTPPNYVEDLNKLLNHMELEKVTLVGHSIGGQLATEFTLEYPELVEKLILIAPGLSGFVYSNEFISKIQAVSEAALNLDKMVELALEVPTNKVIINHPNRKLMDDMLRHHFIRLKEWATFESIWPEVPAIERLSELSAKTLYMIGKMDHVENYRLSEYFRQVPDIQFVEIEGADHMVTLTHPMEAANHILRFLEE
ncbi:alpha/beta fold hydrolase [Bacillus litorisediminis]|uniref:alpha/beta fold hydrolase n=1 Tax=Bacillus litorisediminis TaxID=2922713 RepID=UPI001FAE6F42|nr:alpha/beta hydrolase [Bacillus litorisediminis]